jgi:EPS-associated MarR family transcriptional regulator
VDLTQDVLLFETIRTLEKNPAQSQRDLASALGVSVGRVNFCLKALAEKGLVKVENYRTSTNRLAYLYLLTPAGVAEKALLTRRFLARKMAEYDALKSEIAALQRDL